MLWTTLSIGFCKCYTTQRRLPETTLLTDFVQTFIQPYIKSIILSDDTLQRSFSESPVNKAIRELIEDLRPFLQDEDIDETSIIEFLPKANTNRAKKKTSSEPKMNIRKYEKIKSDIKTALEKEAVSAKIKKKVMNTLDELIAQLIENQCSWNGENHSSAVIRSRMIGNHNITIDEWEGLKTQYLNLPETKHTNKSMALFNKFHKFFSKMINDTQHLSKNHKIKCQLIQVDDDDNILRKNTGNTKVSCKEFKICSDELKDFLIDFYKSLNDTTVSVFKNYAAMYMKDVLTDRDDNHDSSSVPNVLDNMSNAVENRVSKGFILELKKLKLDKNKNKEANVKILHEFVKVTVIRVLKHIKRHLAPDLALLKARELLTVKQDININLDVDLGNLKADIKSRVCTVFVTCNGRVAGNRRSMSDSGTPRIGRNSVYVNLQVNVDDKLKDDIFSNAGMLISKRRIPESYNGIKKSNKMVEYRKHNNINVTRTTIGVSTTENITPNISAYNNDAIMRNGIIEIF